LIADKEDSVDDILQVESPTLFFWSFDKTHYLLFMGDHMEGKRHQQLKQAACRMGREIDFTTHCPKYSRDLEGINRNSRPIIFLDANGKRVGGVDKEVNHE
jgi:hypothetical protein